MKVTIIGLGVIGKAQAELFRRHHITTFDIATDPIYRRYPASDIAESDFAIICVGTPEAPDGSADVSHVEGAAAMLPLDLPVVLRSTVPPGTTDRVLSTGRPYCHAPEFLGENVLHSWQRSADVPYMILGGNPESTLFFKTRFAQVFPGTIHECSAMESELAKYAANLYWATRVTFVNEFARICETFGVDYERVREAWLTDPRMTSVYTKRAGYPPGFDGRCWPKDLAALIAASEDAGYPPGFLAAIAEANRGFRAPGVAPITDLTKRFPDIPDGVYPEGSGPLGF